MPRAASTRAPRVVAWIEVVVAVVLLIAAILRSGFEGRARPRFLCLIEKDPPVP